MSVLIDYLVEHVNSNNAKSEINGKWYVAKWEEFRGYPGLISRLKDALRVLCDKSRAYHFKEDYLK